ncbi:hypothetical protein CDAR_122001 [Caerostris darwini]|uniref:Uncharacterized protein n=1 Tax=Caerostris darwini TaxID=1538125 RepID=A0AAV4PMW6_9ARAC|nr:hypothetical protein CDAR_122001 [Caerostris darwini]
MFQSWSSQTSASVNSVYSASIMNIHIVARSLHINKRQQNTQKYDGKSCLRAAPQPAPSRQLLVIGASSSVRRRTLLSMPYIVNEKRTGKLCERPKRKCRREQA